MAREEILVTGGAGFIGSHVVLALREAGWPVVVLDDLSTGQRAALPPDVPLVEGSTGDRRLLADLLAGRRVAAVMHFAASLIVPESMRRPIDYYRNNTANSLTLIEACLAAGIDRLVFSSSAAVYGNPATVPVSEDAPAEPLSPYGRSKLMTETMLRDAGAAHGLRHVALRYFNVAGADPAGRAGLFSKDVSHLIKVACEAALGRRGSVPVFGDDYPTADGTCVRDFVHVSDLADAHLRALRHLSRGGPSLTLNCGYGRGHSVRQVIDTTARVSGRSLAVEIAPRRPGDAAEVVAAASRIRRELDWRPRHDDLARIIRDSLAAERRRAPDSHATA